MAPARGVVRGPISRTPARSQWPSAVHHQQAALRSSCRNERHRIAAQVDSCARGGRAFVGVARMHAATPCSLVPACPECCEASKGTPSRGDPEHDVPYLSRITLIACPKMWAKTAEFVAAARLSGHTLT